MNKLIELEDTLGEASSFVQAIHLAAAGLGDMRDTNAIQVVAEQITVRLEKARSIVDNLSDPSENTGGIDLYALKKAVNAEIIRRAALKTGEDQQ
ncbi:hypothetical protein [Rhizobium rhizogenes]|uniref:Uncharacterized protein n=1 Tax=Rhizobium rhizogenes NBRC 13257 TaxID=1220581 RepID=A0AA87U7C4_RHIRH|nr:hypothetical protein [Rhizobium rhizogenes]NTG68228.1 hypothetical protein [Rhizobium rhizogenes]NTI69047.1 hypothetical protein [Rhizobium rhizogenes]TRB12872.1 hypothetical protein EXN67_09375 [Rhizobium rhizogenes]TRB37469.1 hypothetical protein EXN73_31005 [Rhizobium rhizogenes]TRB52255.1 hypothetical protein EXN71_31445 [Rhizobium rhizogenes]